MQSVDRKSSVKLFHADRRQDSILKAKAIVAGHNVSQQDHHWPKNQMNPNKVFTARQKRNLLL
ncbi:hypothetical protein [Yoonia sp. R2-816]|uniref:hypothetical protein n=1 Tax=Yoonia sp. R2-816 TaxID=3342638 RepID=UPI003726B152